MTMSRNDIIAYGTNILINDRIATPVYYFTPLNDKTTQLRNMSKQVYQIPTNKLSDIHAILCTRHPDKDYYIEYEPQTDIPPALKDGGSQTRSDNGG